MTAAFAAFAFIAAFNGNGPNYAGIMLAWMLVFTTVGRLRRGN